MLAGLVAELRGALGILAKRDIQLPARYLASVPGMPGSPGMPGPPGVPGSPGSPGAPDSVPGLGDDCAVIADGAGYLLLAAEGIWPAFLAGDPWFAGYSAIMVNVSDIHAMGGRPLAVVDVLWGTSPASLEPVCAGMAAASRVYGVPIVGGHTSARSPYDALAVAILGRAVALLSSFAARPGDVLLAAVDLRGAMHQRFPFWNASTDADPARLRGDLELLPRLAEQGLCDAAKDISMGGVVGTALMLLETSGAGAVLDVDAVPRPPDVPLGRWLAAFPSYGFVLSVRPERAADVIAAFAGRDLACAAIGAVDDTRRLALRRGAETEVLWDLAAEPLTGLGGAP
jgi:AIR synthase-related protein